MNECIIYYDGFNHCNDPVFVTKRALKTTLLVTEQHKKRKIDTFFNLNWYQKKIFWGIGIIEIHDVLSLQNVFKKSKPIQSRNQSRTLIPSIKNLNLRPQEWRQKR